MNLDDYLIQPVPYDASVSFFQYVHEPTGEVLLTTERVSATTLLRLATEHNLRRPSQAITNWEKSHSVWEN